MERDGRDEVKAGPGTGLVGDAGKSELGKGSASIYARPWAEPRGRVLHLREQLSSGRLGVP